MAETQFFQKLIEATTRSDPAQLYEKAVTGVCWNQEVRALL
jgi:hypothetical protein